MGSQGSAVPPDLAGSAAAERRQLTVMFTDLVDSTVMASRLDPEDWHDLLKAYYRAVDSVIESFGGTVQQYLGDGILAFFGWPRALDSASRSAVAASLAVVDAVTALNDRPLPPGTPTLAARVAVDTGLVMVGDPSVAGSIVAVGDTLNRAARLQSAGKAGEIIVGPATGQLVAGLFELQPTGPLSLKGIDGPVEAYRLLGANASPSRLNARELTPFVGRTAELDALRSHWRVATQGRSEVVVVIGEAGVGKSRLVREFLATTEPERSLRLFATCEQWAALSPLAPFARLMGTPPRTPDEAVLWVHQKVRDQTVVFVLEDAHWADPSTIEAVTSLAGLPARLMVLLTSRDTLGDGAGTARSIFVRGLDAEDSRRLVEAAALSLPLTPELRDRLVERSGGFPLFLEELTRVADTDRVRLDAGLPATLDEILSARLDRLGPAKALAQEAAVLGFEPDRETLASLSSEPRSVVENHLAELVDGGVLTPLGNGSYRFRHALLHEAAYNSMLRRDRRKVHGEIAVILRGSATARERPELIAIHLGRAGHAGDAADAWQRAARRAARSNRFKEASSHLLEALEQLSQLLFNPDQDRSELQIRIRLAQYLAAIDQADPDVARQLERAFDLATAERDAGALVEVQLTLAAHYQAVGDYPAIHGALDRALDAAHDFDAAWAVPIIGLMRGAVEVWEGNPRTAIATIREALIGFGLSLDQHPSSGDAPAGLGFDVVVAGYVMAGLAEWLIDERENGLRLTEWACQLAALSTSPHAQCLGWATAGIVHQLDGNPAAVRDLARKTLALPDDHTTSQFREWATALLDWAGGQAPQATSTSGHQATFMRPYLLALVAERTRDTRSAMAALDEALWCARASGERFAEAELLRLRAEALTALGRLPDAHASFEEAQAVARAQGAAALERRAAESAVRPADPRVQPTSRPPSS